MTSATRRPLRSRSPTRRKPLPAHPAAELFPETTGADYQAIKADIKQQGQLHPIITVGEAADMQVLAGRTRQRACLDLGIQPKYQPYQGNDPIGFVIGDNVLRRHLNAKQRRDLIAKLLKLQPHLSNRQIAKQVKRDDKTVAKIRRDLEARAEIPHVEVRTDSKGRQQPASKQSRQEAPAEAKSPAAPPASLEAALDVVVAELKKQDDEAHEVLLDLIDQLGWENEFADLTDDARSIADKLIDMDDQNKLRRISRYVNDHLRHPDRDPHEKMIALGQLRTPSLHGPLSKTEALKRYRNPAPAPDHSWRVEAVTNDGRRWSNGVRLASREEAETYIESHTRFELEQDGYVTAEVVRDDAAKANCQLIRRRKGGRVTLCFRDGQCGQLHWKPVGSPTNEKSSGDLRDDQGAGRDVRPHGEL
jgi:hypothetical protein